MIIVQACLKASIKRCRQFLLTFIKKFCLLRKVSLLTIMTKKWHIYNHSLIWFWDNCKIYVIEFWLYPWRTCIKSFEIWASYSERVHKLMCLKWTTRIFRIERFKAFSVGGFSESPSIKIYTFYFKITNVTFYDLITKHINFIINNS